MAAVSAGFGHTCALTTAGGLKCWGFNGSGELGDGTSGPNNFSATPVDVIGLTSGVAAVSAGFRNACALTTASGLKCWGDNFYGQLGDGTTTDRSTPVDVVGFPGAVADATLTVTSIADGGDTNPGDGACDDGTGSCTLRAAIEEANANSGLDGVVFAIPAAGPHTIRPGSALPTITDPVVIDGYTQPGASPNTNGPGLGSNAFLLIELDGSNARQDANGLRISAGNSTVRGLVINRFSGSGILLEVSSGNLIEGNLIGTDVTGTANLGNASGVHVVQALGNTIGGIAAGARNVISGNGGNGVFINGPLAASNLVFSQTRVVRCYTG